MVLLILLSIITYTAYGSDYCSWNRAVQPENENNAATYNFINGEFVRDRTFSSGLQTDLYAGQPYYKMTLTNCYVQTLWLFRHIDAEGYPPINHWVISGSVGTKPAYGYAYCGPDSGVDTDPATPSGDCDGNWMVGQPGDAQTAGHELDKFFKVMIGGCPQVTCSELTMYTNQNDRWVDDSEGVTHSGIFTYTGTPNIYERVDTVYSLTGKWFLFWNYKTWRWAINEYIDGLYPYDECELYKAYKGFTSVADVVEGDYTNSVKGDGDTFYYVTSGCETCSRFITCSGYVATPGPTAASLLEPTAAPAEDNFCNLGWAILSPWAIQLCGFATPSPATINTWTGTPSAAPVTASPTNTGDTKSPTPAPVTPVPTNPGTAKPTSPITQPPTVYGGTYPPTTEAPTSKGVPGNPSDPTAPTTAPIYGAYTPTAAPTDEGNTVNCNAYLLCVVMALYKLLF